MVVTARDVSNSLLEQRLHADGWTSSGYLLLPVEIVRSPMTSVAMDASADDLAALLEALDLNHFGASRHFYNCDGRAADQHSAICGRYSLDSLLLASDSREGSI